MGVCNSKVKNNEENVKEEIFINDYIKTLQEYNTNTFILNCILNYDFEKQKRDLIQEYKIKLDKNHEKLNGIKNKFEEIGLV